jgi:hypothetical protein
MAMEVREWSRAEQRESANHYIGESKQAKSGAASAIAGDAK